MAELTCGERVVRCFIGESIDQVPFGVGLGWDPWGETLDHFRCQSGIQTLDLREHFQLDKSFALPDVRYGIYPEFEPVILEETPEFYIHRDGRGITY